MTTESPKNSATEADAASAQTAGATAIDPELVLTVRSDGDWLLQYLVRLANAGVEIGVTMNVGGFLVS